MLTLTALSTHQQVSRRDGRLVIAHDFPLHLADHTAALIFARYDDRWIAHPLDTSTVFCNQEPTRSAQVVMDGDLWEAAGEKFQTQLTREPSDQSAGTPPLRTKSSCKIRVSHSENKSRIYRLPKPEITIGRSRACDIQVEDSRFEAQHLLICCVAGFWYMHDLSRGGGDDGFHGFFLIRNGEGVRIGLHRLEFVIQQRVSDPAGADTETSTGDSNETRGFPETPSSEEDSAKNDNGGPDLAPSVTVSPLPATQETPATSVVPDDPCRTAAQTSFNLLFSFSRMRGRRPRFSLDRWRSRLVVWRGVQRVEDAFLEMRWIQAFEELQPLIRKAPFDRSLLLTFARMCELAQLPDLCLQVLQILNQQYPDDHIVLRGLARITQFLGEQDQPLAKRAERYWKHVQQLCPAESREIESTIRTIQLSLMTSRQRR
jgi:hypothetical protein